MPVINAAGELKMLVILIQGKRMMKAWVKEMAEWRGGKARLEMTPSGGIDNESYVKFLQSLIENQPPGQKRIITADGHSTRVSLETLVPMTDLLKGGTEVVINTPHLSHVQSPLDVGVFKAVNSYYDAAKAEGVANGSPVSVLNTLRWLKVAWDKVLGPTGRSQIIRNAFRHTGIYPFNREAYPDSAYEPGEHERFQKGTKNACAVQGPPRRASQSVAHRAAVWSAPQTQTAAGQPTRLQAGHAKGTASKRKKPAPASAASFSRSQAASSLAAMSALREGAGCRLASAASSAARSKR